MKKEENFEEDIAKEDLDQTVVEEISEDDLQDSQIEILNAENKKLREDYLRAFADSENTKKRCSQEIEKNSKFAISSFAKALLSVADNLQRAIDSVHETKNEECQNLLQGIELTSNEMMKVFEKFAIIKIDCMGKVFDPNFQQVIQEVVDNKKAPGTIIAELQTGYIINDRILREAMVVVTKKA